MPAHSLLAAAAVLFDLDGVLVNSRIPVERQWRRWAAEHALDPGELLKVAHGHRTIETIRQFAPQLDVEAEAAEIERRETEDKDGLAAIPGARELVTSLPSSRWAIATSGGKMLATERLRHVGLPVPAVLVSADDVTRGKPHPEPYLKAAAGLGVPPELCVVIEDAPYGITAAHRAGMKAIGVLGAYRLEQIQEADAITGSVAGIHATWEGGQIMLHVSCKV
ncbi:MAG: HAD-IA family hydrolase [Acidobacteria bacterium]|nr:HAD-IA family hydrolase [Acidobacteriota bacterium]